jgi:hypothetical protein
MPVAILFDRSNTKSAPLSLRVVSRVVRFAG